MFFLILYSENEVYKNTTIRIHLNVNKIQDKKEGIKMVKKVIQYETSDGKKFTDKNEAQTHEKRLNGLVFQSERDMWEYFKDKHEIFIRLQSPQFPPYNVEESYCLVEDATNSLSKEYQEVYIEHKNGHLRRMFLFDFLWKQLKPRAVIGHFRTTSPHEEKYTDEQIMIIYNFAETEAYGQDETVHMFDELIKVVDSLNE